MTASSLRVIDEIAAHLGRWIMAAHEDLKGQRQWRWLGQDALRPWRHRYGIFPRDPASAALCRLHGPVASGYTVTMSHFRLCYRDPKQRFNVVIMEAPSMIHARLKAALAAHDGGMIFTEGHELGAEMAPLVQPGRVLSADEAMELLSRFKPTSGRVAKKPG